MPSAAPRKGQTAAWEIPKNHLERITSQRDEMSVDRGESQCARSVSHLSQSPGGGHRAVCCRSEV
jgi:hypothetical protein